MPYPSEPRPRPPAGLPVKAERLSSATMGRAYDAVANRPTDPEGHTHPAPREVQEPPPVTQRKPKSERRVSRGITFLFALSVFGSLMFCGAYVALPLPAADLGQVQNMLLGTGLGLAMLGLGLGMILIGNKLIPAVQSVQERPPHHSEPEDELAAEQELLGGLADEVGLRERKMLRRTMLVALGILPFPFIFALRSMGPRLGDLLRINSWKAGDRLVDPDTGKPVRLGDLPIGGKVTVMPEGHLDANKPVNAESAVALIRLPPGVNKPLPGHADWAPYDHVAYSMICTHAGCPVNLYHQQIQVLLCPCHQSTFYVPEGCKVVFGPAPRPLPQLDIYVDRHGYFRARHTFRQALGPSFWERTG